MAPWQQALEGQGPAGLKQAGRTGRKPKLSADGVIRLEEALVKGPDAWRYAAEPSTTQRVADLFQRLFGVLYRGHHVGRVLGQMRCSCPHPRGPAKQRNEAAIRRWKRMEWRPIRKKPRS
jgi:transposase